MTRTIHEFLRNGSLCAAAVLLIPLLLNIAGCGGREPAVVLGEEPFDRVVKVDDDLAALEKWVESKQRADMLVHIDAVDDIAVVPPMLETSMKNAGDHLKHGNTDVIYDIASFLEVSGTLNLGELAGLYDRVVWIFPLHRPVSELGLDAFRSYLMRARGYQPSDLTDLHVNGRWIEGTLGGVPVTVTTIEDFDPGERTAIVDIDLAYFAGMQAQNPGYKLGTASLLDFLRALKEKGLHARFATITLSRKGRPLPVVTRYLADLIVEGLGDPAKLFDTPDKWSMMIEAEGYLEKERFLAADSVYSRLLEEYPRNAGLQYMHGATLALLGWGRECARLLTEAYRIDEAYLPGFFQVANIMASRGQLEVAEAVVSSPILREAVPIDELNYNLGIMYIAGGRPDKALPKIEAAAQFKGDDVDLTLLIYRTARDAGEEASMLSSLEKIVGIDRKLVNDRMPWVFRELGKLYEKAGERVKAERMYLRYIEAAPNDSAAVELRKKLKGKSSME